MKHKELKKELVQSGKYEDFCYQMFVLRSTGNYELMNDASAYDLSSDEFIASCQLRNAKNKTWSRLYDHARFLAFKYPGKVFFITLTFNDWALSLSPSYRRDMVSRFLNEYCLDYIANIDYGSENGREHYHAIIVPRSDLSLSPRRLESNKVHYYAEFLDGYKQKYGFYECELIDFDADNIEKVSRYLAKLSNHSIKVKQTKIMTKKNSEYHSWKNRCSKTNYHNPVAMMPSSERQGTEGIIIPPELTSGQ